MQNGLVWLFCIAFGQERELIIGLSDYKWVELPVNAKINEWITSGDYNQQSINFDILIIDFKIPANSQRCTNTSSFWSLTLYARTLFGGSGLKLWCLVDKGLRWKRTEILDCSSDVGKLRSLSGSWILLTAYLLFCMLVGLSVCHYESPPKPWTVFCSVFVPINQWSFIHHKTFSFIMMSLSVRSLRDRFCMSRKAGPGGGGWVHPRGEKEQHGCTGLSYKDFCWSRMGHFSCFSYKLICKTVSFICMASSSSI